MCPLSSEETFSNQAGNGRFPFQKATPAHSPLGLLPGAGALRFVDITSPICILSNSGGVTYWHQVGKKAAAVAGLSFSANLEKLIYTDSLHNETG
jgi:hypothetical protein